MNRRQRLRKLNSEVKSMEAVAELKTDTAKEAPAPFVVKAAERVLFNTVATLNYVQARSPGLTLEALEKPETWAALAGNLRPMDRIFVTDDLLTFYADCVVLDVNRGQALVKILQSVKVPAVSRDWQSVVPEGYRIFRSTFAGEGFCIERKRDAKVIEKGHRTGEEALEALMKRASFQSPR
jgi:hypothetical protein